MSRRQTVAKWREPALKYAVNHRQEPKRVAMDLWWEFLEWMWNHWRYPCNNKTWIRNEIEPYVPKTHSLPQSVCTAQKEVREGGAGPANPTGKSGRNHAVPCSQDLLAARVRWSIFVGGKESACKVFELLQHAHLDQASMDLLWSVVFWSLGTWLMVKFH